jgi:hypothetical protein
LSDLEVFDIGRIAMKQFAVRLLCFGALVMGLQIGQALLPTAGAEAAQAWYCVCKGEKKRLLASTRHCELQMGLPKGKSCTSWQYRKVYGPACREQGCRLPLFN